MFIEIAVKCRDGGYVAKLYDREAKCGRLVIGKSLAKVMDAVEQELEQYQKLCQSHLLRIIPAAD